MNKGLKNKQESSAFYSTGIFKNMLTLATGSGVAKVIGLISIPFITRIYGPENLGALSIFIAIVALMVPFGSLGIRYQGASMPSRALMTIPTLASLLS